jgi:hypothetical protein
VKCALRLFSFFSRGLDEVLGLFGTKCHMKLEATNERWRVKI